MLKRFGQIAALALLSALLVYAPELFTAVSAPYRVSVPQRALLRVVLCASDADAVSSLYDALDAFRREHPSVHLRVTRADEAQLLALTDPLPDVYIYPESASLPAERLFLPLTAQSARSSQTLAPGGYRRPVAAKSGGETLVCSVGAKTRNASAALALASALCGGDAAGPP